MSERPVSERPASDGPASDGPACDATPTSGTSALLKHSPAVLAALALGAALLTIWLPPFPPCQDAPGHIVTVQVMLDPEPFARLLEASWAQTGQGFLALAWLFGHTLPLLLAVKLALTVILLVTTGAMWSIARAAGGSAAIAVAAGSLLSVGWPYAMGFFNYTSAVALGLAALALWLRPGRGTAVTAAAVFLLTVWAHVIVAAMFVAQAVAMELLMRAPRGRRLVRLAALVPAALAALAIAGPVFMEQDALGAVAATRGDRLTPLLALRDLIGTAFVGFSPLAWSAAPLAIALIAGLAGRRGVEGAAPRALALAGLAWTLLYFALPTHALGWHYAGPRVLVLAYVVPLAAVSATAWRGFGPLLFTACAALAAFDGLPRAIAEGERVATTVEGFDEQPVGRAFMVTWRPEALDPVAPYAQPGLGVGHYALLHGGAAPGLFASNPLLHSIVFAAPMEELFPATRDLFYVVSTECADDPACAADDTARADRVAMSALSWDTLVLVEPPTAFRERLGVRGFERVGAGLMRPRPSGLRVTYQPPKVAEGTLVHRVGHLDTTGWFRSETRANTPELGRDLRTWDVRPLPAGPLAVQIFVDLDGDAELSEGEVVVIQQHIVVPVGGIATLEP